MPLLTGPARFNGVNGEYSVILDQGTFEREIRLGVLRIWDAFDGNVYWQANFGSPIYRRPAPFSVHEGKQWLEIWTKIAAGAGDCNFEITSILGNTKIDVVDGWVTTTTDAGNITEFGPFEISKSVATTLRPIAPDRIDFTLPFDLSIGVPRAQGFVADRPAQFMIDTGADHSIFASSLPHEALGVTVRVNAGGGIVDFTLGRLLDVRIGELMLPAITPFFTPFETMPGPLRFLRGIIGQDILGRAAVTFDQKRGVILGKKETSEELRWPLDGSYAPCRVDGNSGWYRIDTGSQFTLHKFSLEQNETSKNLGHRGIGGPMRVKPLKISTVQLDDVSFSNVRAFEEFCDADPEVIAGNIGNGLLKEIQVTMDFSRGLSGFRSRA